MNSVEKVKKVCKERKIPISKLERECGFANGYIGQLKKGTFPNDRLIKISNYLSMSIESLFSDNLDIAFVVDSTESTGNHTHCLNEDTAKLAQEMYEDPDMRSLFDMKRKMPADRFSAHVKFMKELYEKENPSDY